MFIFFFFLIFKFSAASKLMIPIGQEAQLNLSERTRRIRAVQSMIIERVESRINDVIIDRNNCLNG